MSAEPNNEDYSPEEAARRRDEVLKRMLNTPPQPRAKSPSQSRKTTDSVRAAQQDHDQKIP